MPRCRSTLTLTAFARKAARRADVYYTVGCLTRCASYLVQALFALNRAHMVNEKTALWEIDHFEYKPDAFAARATELLAHPGATVEELSNSVVLVEALFRKTVELAREFYSTRFQST